MIGRYGGHFGITWFKDLEAQANHTLSTSEGLAKTGKRQSREQ